MRTKILASILGSEGRKKVLKALLDHPHKDWTVPELEKITGVSHATVWRTVTDLEKSKVLRSSLLGKKTKIFRLVADSPHLQALKSGLNAEVLPLREVAEKFVHEISRFRRIKACILYGSVARGTASPESDVDILVLADRPTQELTARITKIAADLSYSTGCSIVPTIISVREFKGMLAAKHEFVLAVKKEGITLLERGGV